MKRIISILVCLFCLILSACVTKKSAKHKSQLSKKSNEVIVDLEPFFIESNDSIPLDLSRVQWGCLNHTQTNNSGFGTDSVLYSFYRKIDAGDMTILQSDIKKQLLTDLLNRSRDLNFNACILPFLRLADSKADSIYIIVCRTTAFSRIQMRVYCSEPRIQFLMLFFLQFKYFDPTILNDNQSFEKLILVNKITGNANQNLTTSDLNTLYDIYLEQLTKNRNVINKNPLSGTKYEWRVELGDVPELLPGQMTIKEREELKKGKN